MSNIHHLHQHIPAEELRLEQASEWIAKLDRGLNDSEQQQLKVWLAQDPANVAELLNVAELWDKLDDLSRLSDLFPMQAKANNKRQFSRWKMALAASVLLFCTTLFYQGINPLRLFSSDPSLVATQASYQTGVGETSVFILPDHSKLTLNTNSFVQIKYSQKARLIELQRGEINIEVAHNKARPLSVMASGKVIQAVGTAFNVEVKDKLVELIVTDGKVLVAEKQNNGSDLAQAEQKLPQSSMAISKGEKVNLDLTGSAREQIEKVAPADIAASLSWRSGNLIFRGESLQDAMAEISRYTDISFELVDDEKLRQVRIAGMFKTGDVTGLLEVLKQNFNIANERRGKDRIILKYAS